MVERSDTTGTDPQKFSRPLEGCQHTAKEIGGRFAGSSSLALMPFGNSELESQRDSIVQPRVATEELPWVNAPTMTYPNGVASSHQFPANLNFRKALRLNQVHNPDSELGDEIEQTFREPITVGRVTPCAPRLQPTGAKISPASPSQPAAGQDLSHCTSVAIDGR